MSEWLDTFLRGDYGGGALEPSGTVFVLLLAFVLGQLIGWIYIWTHQTLSYSQSFVASLTVLPVIVALMMMLMAGSLMIAFGLLAVFAVVRFRNVLKDTRDTTYILWTIVEGMAVGTQRFTTAVLGALAIAIVLLYLRISSFGARYRFDAILSLEFLNHAQDARNQLLELLRRHAIRMRLTSERSVDATTVAMSYRLQLRDPSRSRELEQELTELAHIHHVSLYMQEDESEV
jgi:uncharacterized membrane protein YhiD involved in acid resistance